MTQLKIDSQSEDLNNKLAVNMAEREKLQAISAKVKSEFDSKSKHFYKERGLGKKSSEEINQLEVDCKATLGVYHKLEADLEENRKQGVQLFLELQRLKTKSQNSSASVVGVFSLNNPANTKAAHDSNQSDMKTNTLS